MTRRADQENGASPWGKPEKRRLGRTGWRLLILAGVAGTGFLGLLALVPPGALGNSDGPEFTRAALVVVLVLMALAASRQSLLAIGGQMAAWALLMMALVAGYGYRFELTAILHRVQGELFPSQVQTPDDATITVRRSTDGHFHIDAEAGGRPIRFLFDTGASGIVLTRDDAARLGFSPATLNFTQRFQTANGTTRGAPVKLRALRIGPWRFPDVPASVNEGELQQSLLGMRFLSQLGSLEISRDTLTLRR